MDDPEHNDGKRDSSHDRLIILEADYRAWKKSVDRRLDECSSGTKWIVGLIGVALVGLVTALLTRGL